MLNEIQELGIHNLSQKALTRNDVVNINILDFKTLVCLI